MRTPALFFCRMTSEEQCCSYNIRKKHITGSSVSIGVQWRSSTLWFEEKAAVTDFIGGIAPNRSSGKLNSLPPYDDGMRHVFSVVCLARVLSPQTLLTKLFKRPETPVDIFEKEQPVDTIPPLCR